MLFGDAGLRRKLLKPIGPGGLDAAPLRAFGKLEIAPEFFDAGCDDTPAGRWFREWVREGCKRLERQFDPAPLQLRRHRLLLTSDGGRVWVVACLWNSRDKPSEQGHQRNHAFALFVVVPALKRSARLAPIAAHCAPLWADLESIYPTLLTLDGRPACLARIAQLAICVPPSAREAQETLRATAANMRLSDWLARLDGQHPGGGLLIDLQRELGQSRRSGRMNREVWRVPLARRLEPDVQLAVWLRWFDINVRRAVRDCSLYVPISDDGSSPELTLVLHQATTEDFTLLSNEAEHLERMAGRTLGGAPADRAPGAGGPVVLARAGQSGPSLADFADGVLREGG